MDEDWEDVIIFSSGEQAPGLDLPPSVEWVEIPKGETSTYVDHAMLMEDAEFVIELLTRQLAELRSAKPPVHMSDLKARWNAVVVSYARMFGTGSRHRLTPDVHAPLGSDPVEAHKYFIDLRSVEDHPNEGLTEQLLLLALQVRDALNRIKGD
jgi:hypothetical protein